MEKKMKFLNGLIFPLFIMTCQLMGSWAYAGNASSDEEKWRFHLIPYFWMAGLEGDVTLKGFESKVDASFGDIWDNLEFGGLVHFEARKGEWGFFLDPIYLKLSSDAHIDNPDVGRINADVTVEQWLVEFGGLYRLGQWPLGGSESDEISLDLLAGGRYWDLTTRLDLSIPLADLGRSYKKSKDWIDPFVGLRLQADLTQKLALVLRGDIGGFGVGSDFSWNASALFGYSFSEMISLWVGYRVLDVDYEDGSGTGKFAYDVTMSGPILGLAFRF